MDHEPIGGRGEGELWFRSRPSVSEKLVELEGAATVPQYLRLTQLHASVGTAMGSNPRQSPPKTRLCLGRVWRTASEPQGIGSIAPDSQGAIITDSNRSAVSAAEKHVDVFRTAERHFPIGNLAMSFAELPRGFPFSFLPPSDRAL